MQTFTKPNCNLFIEERLTILKNIRDKCVTIMNKNLEIYGACRHKTTFINFCYALMIPFLCVTGQKVSSSKGFQILGIEPVNGHFNTENLL